MSDISKMLDECAKRSTERIRFTAATCVSIPIHELTDDQKFCIAVMAGVPMLDPEVINGVLVMKTAPCAITKIDGRLIVHYRQS